MSPKVLCIEDNPDNMLLAQRAIQALGYTFIPALNGQSGLDIAARELPDVILLDINLPDIDGYAVAAKLRASQDQALATTPIIAITANALRGDAEKVLAAGCDIYMSKPINIQELMTRVQTICEKKA